MKILVDTDVVLDFLLDRRPHSLEAAAIFTAVERNLIVGYIAATTITTIYYLTARSQGAKQAKKEIQRLLSLFEIAPVNRTVLERALVASIKDLEDAVVLEAARLVGADALVTRNVVDFQTDKMPVYSPGELLSTLRSTSKP